jgi:hypothetical protein
MTLKRGLREYLHAYLFVYTVTKRDFKTGSYHSCKKKRFVSFFKKNGFILVASAHAVVVP